MSGNANDHKHPGQAGRAPTTLTNIGSNRKKEGKQAKYRKKMITQGKCPRCGTPCAPYYLCPAHRDKRRIQYTLGRMVVTGQLIKKEQGYLKAEKPKPLKTVRCPFYKTKPQDMRKLPRVGTKYINLKQMIIDILKEHGPLTEDEIATHATDMVIKMKEEIKKATLTNS